MASAAALVATNVHAGLSHTLIVREPKWGAGGIGELGEGGILGGRDFSSEPTVVPNVNGKTCGEGNVPAVG